MQMEMRMNEQKRTNRSMLSHTPLTSLLLGIGQSHIMSKLIYLFTNTNPFFYQILFIEATFFPMITQIPPC